jgi:hypothetical protein
LFLASGNINKPILRGAFELLASGNISPNKSSGKLRSKVQQQESISIHVSESMNLHELSCFCIFSSILKESSYPGMDKDNSSIAQGNIFQTADSIPLVVMKAI